MMGGVMGGLRLVMNSLRPANRCLVQQRILLRGVGASCEVYNYKIAKKNS